jgi:hypothetical protein
VYETLKAGFVVRSADSLTGQLGENAAHAGPEHRVLHPGDPFGRVFAWVWDDDQDQAMVLLADYLASLRQGRGADIDPPVRLDEVLAGLSPALPHAFTDYPAVVAKARRDVPGYYGLDPNT